MTHSFDYFQVIQTNGQLDVDDISNFAIRATNDLYNEYYLIVDTVMGQTKILTFGPMEIDIDAPPDRVTCSYQKIMYDEKKIINIVNKFLNDSMKAITQATIITKEECLMNIRNMRDFIIGG